MNKRKKIIASLRNKRYSYIEIGRKLGISKQRVHQIHTGYVPPLRIKVKNLKILCKRKRIYLGLPEKINSNNGGRDFVREIVRERDNQTCQRCFKVWKQGQRKFDVNHLDEKIDTHGKGVIKYDKENLDKLITFCHKCHYAWHKEMGHTKNWNTAKI